MRFGWTWVEGEDEQAGMSWIQIGPLTEEGFAEEEMATILCRDYERVKVEHPEWITQKEQDAQLIVNALNGAEEYGFLVSLGGLCVKWRGEAAAGVYRTNGDIAWRACAEQLEHMLDTRKGAGL